MCGSITARGTIQKDRYGLFIVFKIKSQAFGSIHCRIRSPKTGTVLKEGMTVRMSLMYDDITRIRCPELTSENTPSQTYQQGAPYEEWRTMRTD